MAWFSMVNLWHETEIYFVLDSYNLENELKNMPSTLFINTDLILSLNILIKFGNYQAKNA